MDDVGAIFEVPSAPAELARLAEERSCPLGLLERMLALRYPRWKIEMVLSGDPFPTMDMWVAEVVDRERLAHGLAVHEATWEDDERLSDLFANSPERLGDWDVIVERSPNPFAQQRLQDNAHVKLVVDRGVALAASAYSGRSSIVAGQRVSVGWMGGWRVREGFRRNGYSNLLLNSPGSSSSVFGMVTYWYVRLANSTANTWISHAVRDIDSGSDRPLDKRTASVVHLDAAADSSAADRTAADRTDGQTDGRVRPANLEDLPRCVELINATHDGLDLFRPYTAESLENRLHDLYWGPKPPFTPVVYAWADFAVLVDDGDIVACGGLWDRGRDVRERWRHRETGAEHVLDPTYLMDFGFEPGHEADMAALIGHHVATTRHLGRSSLVAALEFLPAVTEHLTWAAPSVESRSIESMGFASPDIRVDATIARPYTDLAYW